MSILVKVFFDLYFNTNTLNNLSKNTGKFSIEIPMKDGGFSYNEIDNNNGVLPKNTNYYHAGMYYGDIDFTKPVLVNYIVNSSKYTSSFTINNDKQSNFIAQNWTHHYCKNNDSEEATRFSIAHRVLIDKTAFLALENGDTVSSANNNGYQATIDVTGGAGSSSILSNTETHNINVSPNPFVDFINIKSENNISSIRLTNITGELLYEKTVDGFKKEIKIDAAYLNLTQGIYFLMIETDKGLETIRILKE